MEAAEKNFNKKAKVGYATLMSRVMKDEIKRNGALENAGPAKEILGDLTSLDKTASGNFFTGNVSANDFTKLIQQATQVHLKLANYCGGFQTSSDEYRKAMIQIRDAVNQLAQSTASVAHMVTQADGDKKKKMRAVLVKKMQIDSAFDACKNRLEALTKDMGRFFTANNEKEVTKHMEKLKKMQHEFTVLENDYGETNDLMRSYIND